LALTVHDLARDGSLRATIASEFAERSGSAILASKPL